MPEIEELPVVVVGGGQAGLATSHHLTRQGIRHAVLDSEARVGDQWRRRWDSLRLFTPARYDGLPGSTFPAPSGSFPGKDQMADYLEAYARVQGLPVRSGVRALKLDRTGGTYLLDTSAGALRAAHVVVAAGYDRPYVPPFAAGLDAAIRQLHAAQYRNPSQLDGDVLVVGAGTSGVEVAIEAARAGHRTVLAGRGTGAIPGILYAFDGRIFWFYANRVASLATPVGRRMKPLILKHGAPLIRIKMSDAIAAGVERGPRVTGLEEGFPLGEDGRRMEPRTVVWCTGFKRDYSWIKFPVAGPDGYPRQVGGVAEDETGLYFVGLPFQSRFASGLIGGAGEDARVVAEEIAARLGREGADDALEPAA